MPPVERRAVGFREVAAPRTRELVAQPIALLAGGAPAGVVDPGKHRNAPSAGRRRDDGLALAFVRLE